MKILKISQSELPATLMKSLILFAYFAESCDCEAILLTMVVVCVCVCVFHLQNGTVECQSIFCPPPQCPPDTAPIYMPGACCKECQREYTHKQTQNEAMHLSRCIYFTSFPLSLRLKFAPFPLHHLNFLLTIYLSTQISFFIIMLRSWWQTDHIPVLLGYCCHKFECQHIHNAVTHFLWYH